MNKFNGVSNTMSENLPNAYSFQCGLTQDEIRDRFNEAGPWKWVGGDSEYDGLYLRARPAAGSKLRILGENPPSYTIEVFLNRARAENITTEELHQIVTNELLLSIGATKVVPIIG